MVTSGGGWFRYGREAASALLAEIGRSKGAEPLAPVTVVVASNQAGVSVRRQLASGRLGAVCGAGPGLIGVTFVTPYRLAELLGAARLAGQHRRPVSAPVLAAAVRAALADDAGMFDPVAEHPATEAALVASYRELRDLTDAGLAALTARGRRTGEVVRVFRATRQRLEGSWYDEEDLMESATAEASTGQACASLGSVVVYLPQRLSRHAIELLRTVARTRRLAVIAGSTGVARADIEVARSVEALGVTLDPPPHAPRSASAARTTILTASDADEEVRAAVRTVVDAVRLGTSLDRIAVLHAAAEPYARLLHDHLEAAGVATNGAAALPLAGRLAGRTLLALLGLPTGGYRRQDVFAMIAGAPLLQDGRPVPTSAWERISRSAGVIAGRSDWDERLTRLADQLDAEAVVSEADVEPPQWKADRARQEAQRARDLRRFVLGIIDRLSAATAGHEAWAQRSGWAKQLMFDLLGGAARRERWPEIERRSGDRIEVSLDRLAALDGIEAPVGIEVFARTLAVELESDLGRTGRFGEGVLVGPVSMGVGVDLDLLIVVGMAEGTFPATTRDDSLLPDDDREAARGELALRRNDVDRLHHQFLATMSGAASQTLCIPRGDLRRSRDRMPSRWLLDVASALAGTRWWGDDLLASNVAWVTHIASFDAGLRLATMPATAQEHRLRALLAAAPRRRDLQAAASVLDIALARGVAALDARYSSKLTRFDGNLAGHALPSPVDGGTSATRLEDYARCPYGYFLRSVLRVEPLDQPEDTVRISAIDRGTLVHAALEQFVQEALSTASVPGPTTPWSTCDRQRLAEIADDLCTDLEHQGLVGRPIFWRRDRRRIIADLDRLLDADDRHRLATGARPVAAELAFGIDGVDPAMFALDDGRIVPMRGKADRVDQDDDGNLYVLDYKTGTSRNYKTLSAGDPHQGGRRLQLAVYGAAARQHLGPPDAVVRADYWFASSTESFARHGYALSDEVLTEVGRAMSTIVTGIETGLFPPHPQPHTTSPFTDCHYCDPDGLGTAELLRHWHRKRGDPALAAYVDLVGATDDDATEADR